MLRDYSLLIPAEPMHSETWEPVKTSEPAYLLRDFPWDKAGPSRLQEIWRCVTFAHMDRDQIIAKLREHASEWKAAGVVHLFLHGSHARDTAILGSSDVDVIAEFDPRRRLSLVDMVP